MLRRASDSYLEATIPDGVGEISFQYRKAFTGNASRELELLINGVQVATTPAFGVTPSGADATIYTLTHSVDQPGSVVVRIKLTGSATTNRQTTIDNIAWSSFGSGPATNISGTFTSFATFLGTASAAQSVTVGGANLTAGIVVSAPLNFEVSLDNIVFAPSVSLPQTGGAASGTIYVRVAATAPEGAISGNLVLSSAGATDRNVPLSGSVRPTFVLIPYGPESFETTSEPWFTFDQAGSANWQYVTSTRGGGSSSGAPENKVWQANGFGSNVPAVDWLIIGPFDFSSAANPVISFNTLNAFTSFQTIVNELELIVSTNYDGLSSPALATWSDGLPFLKPVSENTKSASGQVSLGNVAGQTGVYIAFRYTAGGTTSNTTALWQVDDVEIYDATQPALALTAPGSLDEGSAGTGTVILPATLGENVTVTVTSADPAVLLVDNGYGDAPAASCEVPIFAGEISAGFNITTIRDFVPGSDVNVQVVAEAAGYDFGQAFVLVRNVDRVSTDLTAGGYTQNFSTFSAATPELPAGWSADGSVLTFPAENNAWGEGFSSGFRGGANVFGYQHTGSTGVLRQILTLRNATAETIDALTISYLGMVARVDETRPPVYTVTVNGELVESLGYSTAAQANIQTTASLTNLSIAPGQIVEIIWTSERGGTSGSSRQIGIGNLSVQLGAALLPPSVSSLAVPAGTITRTSAEVSAAVTSDGGETISAQGFVYAETGVNPNPQLGGTGVTDLPDAATGIGVMSGSLSGLTPGTSYSIAAYATNAQGTTYTPVATFTTISAAISFLGSYAEPFNAFEGSLPTGWSAISSGGVLNYGGAWGTGSAAGFRGGVSDPGVLGYQHTAASGTLTVTASFINDTGAPITTLYVNYLGRVARVDDINVTNDPAWAVSLDGNVIAELAYSTANTSGEGGTPGDELLSAAISGLSIPDGAEFVITWACDRGSLGGTSRQIGVASLQVSTSEIPDPAINTSGSLTSFSATEGTPSAAQSISASGTSLAGSITVTAPANYEVSLDNSTFFPFITLTPGSGTVAPTPVYVRIAASAPVGNPAGQVSLASPGATTQNIAVTGTVSGGGSAYDTWASGFGLDPATTGAPTADPDGDSFSNAQEYAFGTNPTQGNGSLLSSTASGGNLVVTWLERSDVTYNVQSTGNLATSFANDGTVSVVDGPVSPTPPAGYTSKQFTVPASGSKFYRVTAATP